jgi:hypothetical protein
MVEINIPYETCWWFGTMEFYDFPYIGDVIIPTDEKSIIFQRGRSTTNQYIYIYVYIDD